MELLIKENGIPRYPEEQKLAERLAASAGAEWAKFEEELTRKTFSYIEDKYPNIFGDTHKEEVCHGVIERLKANNSRALTTFRGECTLSAYIANQVVWAVRDWLRKNSDRLFEVQFEMPDGAGSSLLMNPAELDAETEFDTRLDKQGIPEVISSLRDEWRWAFLLRYYYFFGFPRQEICLLASKRGVPIKNITELLTRYFEMEESDILSRQVQKKEKVLESLGRLHQKMSRLYSEERLLSTKPFDQDNTKLEDLRSKIDQERRKLQEKRKRVRENEMDVITTPYSAIADILGEENENTVRSYVYYAKKHLREVIEREQ